MRDWYREISAVAGGLQEMGLEGRATISWS